MGTRINYEILMDDCAGPAAILYSNSHHPDFDCEAIFRQKAATEPGPTALVRALLALTYTAHGGHREGDPVFWIDTAPGDRERVLCISYAYALIGGRLHPSISGHSV